MSNIDELTECGCMFRTLLDDVVEDELFVDVRSDEVDHILLEHPLQFLTSRLAITTDQRDIITLEEEPLTLPFAIIILIHISVALGVSQDWDISKFEYILDHSLHSVRGIDIRSLDAEMVLISADR